MYTNVRQQDEMPVLHDKQMPGPVWTKVAPGKWREVAPAATVVADDVADQSAKRARILTFNDKTVADFKNWLDFLQHMGHDAYVTLMRYFVGTGVIEFHDWAGDINAPARFQLNYINSWRFNPWLDCRNINIYGLKYTTATQKITRNAYIPKWCHKFFEKKHLAAAEANGIKVFKSWTKPRLWKALLSA
jgi:hypothetical protein